MTVVQLEVYNYCRALGFGETASLKAAAAARARGGLERVRTQMRWLSWLLGAALLLTLAAKTLV